MKKLTLHLMVATLATSTFLGCGKKDDQAHGGGGMSVPVKAVTALQQPIEEKISVVASLMANEVVEIKSDIEGTIKEIHFDEGQAVKKDQLLFQLDADKLEPAVQQAEADFQLAEGNFKRSKTMLENRTISDQEFEGEQARFESMRAALSLMKERLSDTSIRAPFDGITGARNVSPGQVVGRDTVLSMLVDWDPIKVEFRVPERFLGQLAEKQIIQFHVTAYTNKTFEGSVYFIDPQIDTETRTVLVKAYAPNADQDLRPGMFGNLDLILRVHEKAIVIPETALVPHGNKTFVFTVDTNGVAQQVAVTPGTRLAGNVEIREGLNGGELVIIEGVQKIQSGFPVMITNTNVPTEPLAKDQ